MPEVTVDSLSGHRVSTEILQEILWDYCAENLSRSRATTHEKEKKNYNNKKEDTRHRFPVNCHTWLVLPSAQAA